MGWLADVSGAWFDWQIRALIFSVFVIWAALGTGLRSPVWRCSVLVIGSWMLLLIPLLTLFAPRVPLPILVSDSSFSRSVTGSLLDSLSLPLFFVSIFLSLVCVGKTFRALSLLVRLHRSLRAADDIQGIFDDCVDQVVPNCMVSCCRSDFAEVPLTYGLFTHRIVLPTDSSNWSEQRLRICLMHELWHVQRADWLHQQVATLAHFFNLLNPFVWHIRQQLGKKMECSVDKFCVQSGIDSGEYARALLRQAQAVRSSSSLLSPVYFGAHRYGGSDIQQRIGALVHEPFGWSAVPRARLVPIFASIALFAVLVSVLEPVSTPQVLPSRALWFFQPAAVHSEMSTTEELAASVENWLSLQAPMMTDRAALLGQFVQAHVLPEISVRAYPVEDIDSVFSAPRFTEIATEIAREAAFIPMGLSDIEIPVAPLASHLATPDYPRRELERNREGWVELLFDLNAQGEPIAVRVLQSSGSAQFERAAMRALSASQYDLEYRRSRASSLIVQDLTQTYVFELMDSGESKVAQSARSPP